MMLGWLVLASGYAILVCCDSVVSQSSVPEINAELCVVNPCAARLPISEERNISTCTYVPLLGTRNVMRNSVPARSTSRAFLIACIAHSQRRMCLRYGSLFTRSTVPPLAAKKPIGVRARKASNFALLLRS